MTTRHPARAGFTLTELFVVLVIVFALVGLLLPAMQEVREKARQTGCRTNLAQIALALQNYEMAFEVLPPGTVNATGPIVNKAASNAYHVSWTVQILPYLELATVYHRFDFRYGVYHRRNRRALSYTVATYACPTGGGYAGCHAGRETPIDADNDGVLFLNSAVRIDDVADGCAHTLLVGEAVRGSGLGWASGTRDTLRNTGVPPNAATPALPTAGVLVEDFTGQGGLPEGFEEVDPAKAKPGELAVGGFGSPHPGGAHVSFCDGSIRFLSNEIDRAAFRTLGGRNDGAMPAEF